MKIFINKINHLLQKLWRVISKDVAAMIEELRAIVRNRNYMVRYPKLFAIFSIIEHEQSSQVFELNHDDFQLIKTEILHDEKINNHHVLESLRGLFQSTNLSDVHDQAKGKILHYLYDELNGLIKNNNSYYDPLIKAILRGFPLILSYDDYGVFRKLLQYNSRNSLRLIKYVLDSESFPGFFVEDNDLADIILAAYQLSNKSAFMLLIQYLRRNNLFSIFFERNIHDIKNKILSGHGVEKRGLDYSSVIFSYYEDKWFTNEKKIEKMEQFLQEVFSHNLGLDQKQKVANHAALSLAISMSRRLGHDNSIVEKMLNEVVERFIDKKSRVKKMRMKFLIKPVKIVSENKPSAQIKPREFFAIAPLAPEEYWLMRFANYLL